MIMNMISFVNSNIRPFVKQISIGIGVLIFTIFTISANAQEVRLHGQFLAAAEAGAGFPGIGFGIEGKVGTHFSMSIDAGIGFGDIGRLTTFQPAVNFYFSKKQKGLFIGPTVSYMKISEDKNVDLYIDALYGFGFGLGVKGNLGPKVNLHTILTPQIAIGDFNGSSAVIGLKAGISYIL